MERKWKGKGRPQREKKKEEAKGEKKGRLHERSDSCLSKKEADEKIVRKALPLPRPPTNANSRTVSHYKWRESLSPCLPCYHSTLGIGLAPIKGDGGWRHVGIRVERRLFDELLPSPLFSTVEL